jgi:FtsZ-interacting cell division protein ZipA
MAKQHKRGVLCISPKASKPRNTRGAAETIYAWIHTPPTDPDQTQRSAAANTTKNKKDAATKNKKQHNNKPPNPTAPTTTQTPTRTTEREEKQQERREKKNPNKNAMMTSSHLICTGARSERTLNFR